ncbi:Thiamine-phosphate synthase [Stratiformator vulcanicus]|uniref:Thiamine-phosphate synthase n=1 Tax=Stratiformator vulcanicus TaxID=2527980 RepID=A0A517R5P7_9PLAN|nr:Thiamine-phosphate synthase [Stratiformator vulcanicus]
MEPSDLLAALFSDESAGAALLGEIGFPPPSTQTVTTVEARTAADTLPIPEPSETTDRIRDRAIALARRFGGREVSSEHLAVALLEIESPIRDTANSARLDPDTVRDRLDESIAMGEVVEVDFQLDVDGPHSPESPTDDSISLRRESRRTESVDLFDPAVARIIDATANRCREGLRVVEDFARFVRDDPSATQSLKSLRHGFAEAMNLIPTEWLLSSRNTGGDVGTSITTEAERSRSSPEHVAAASLKRVQESLRSLEEYGKLIDPRFAESIERLRYRAYETEQQLIVPTTPGGELSAAHLMLLLPAMLPGRDLTQVAMQAIAGGVDVIQLRDKNANDHVLLEAGRIFRELTRNHGIRLIMNDRPDVAVAIEADGVHLGQDDLPIKTARRIIGPDRIVGTSTHSIEQIQQAVRDGADYVGVGPTFASTTKHFAEFTGVELLRAAGEVASIPMFAIGGIDAGNVSEVAAAGFGRVAVSGAILNADDPRQAAMNIRAALDMIE